MRQDLGDNQISVYNAGMGGATSYRSLIIFFNLLTRLSPDLVIVYHGINDRGPFYPSNARYFRDVGYGEEFLRRPSYLLHELALRTHNPILQKASELLVPAPVSAEDPRYHENNFRDLAYLAEGHRISLMFMTHPCCLNRAATRVSTALRGSWVEN